MPRPLVWQVHVNNVIVFGGVPRLQRHLGCCSEAYMPIDAFCSGVNLAYFSLGLLLPCDAFLSFFGVLIAAGLMCVDRGPLGLKGTWRLEIPVQRHRSIYISTWEIAGSNFDMNKILNAKNFVVFIFVRPGIIQNIRKFALIQNFPLYGILPTEDAS